MKMIMAIIRPEKLDAVLKALKQSGVCGVTITKAGGSGKEWHLYEPDVYPRVKIEVIVSDGEVEKVKNAILNTAHTGLAGDGMIAVYSLSEVIKISTKQKDEERCDEEK